MIVKLVIVGLGLALLYAAECAIWPLGKCWCCSGTGKHGRDDGKVWRPCRICAGKGSRIRVGRRVWNWYAGKRRAARAAAK